MCGFAGFVSWNRPIGNEDKSLLARMTQVIRHRGPDDEGFYVDSHAALGFRRLAIIDLGGGHQPLSNENGSVWIVFNGEIYNFIELREWLIEKGHQFRTQSDTETIVHLYEELGTACVDKLRGMFAFAIWDARRREVFLARDRVGKKPLYYASTPGRFWFASETKSILQDPSVGMEMDPQAIDAYMTFSYVPAPMTGFKHIHKLPGGHYLRVTAARLDEREYWDWHFQNTPGSVSPTISSPDPHGHTEGAHVQRLRHLLSEAVRVRLMSEVPLGAFLSGGLDSSTIVAFMAGHLNEPVRSMSIGFDYERYDELSYAQQVAQRFRTDHMAYTVKADAIEVLERIVWHLDEPFGDSSAIPTYYLAQQTRQRVTVALSGDGGDEVFAGYDFRYALTQREVRLRRIFSSPIVSPILSAIASVYPRSRHLPRPLRLRTILRNLSVPQALAHAYDISFIAPELRRALYTSEFAAQLGDLSSEDLVLAYFRKTDARHWLDRALYVDAKFYMQNDVLTKVDRMSMAHSLEVRSPLLDQNVMEYMARVPPALKLNGICCKYLLKEAMKHCLPPSTLSRAKQGFSIPLNEWLRDGCRDYAADFLLGPNAFISRFVHPHAVTKIWNLHQHGENYGTELWILLMLELWGTLYVKSVRNSIPQPLSTSFSPGLALCA